MITARIKIRNMYRSENDKLLKLDNKSLIDCRTRTCLPSAIGVEANISTDNTQTLINKKEIYFKCIIKSNKIAKSENLN